ncbi:hypothetical protein LQ567_06695 [Niabella pedocola]|uniref:Uncharacterized protein n=1 Tax=Niabella pedocola TaxID=1752077 RepID=A0ABS8PMV3_9BACT|nr:hypothetical protein [Niabella pedocola]MCD2422444.1 hypothetical protein [Niabella pedocola]
MENKVGYIRRYLSYLTLLLVSAYAVIVLVIFNITDVGYEMYIGWLLVILNGAVYIIRYKYGLFLTGIIFLLSTLNIVKLYFGKYNFSLFFLSGLDRMDTPKIDVRSAFFFGLYLIIYRKELFGGKKRL